MKLGTVFSMFPGFRKKRSGRGITAVALVDGGVAVAHVVGANKGSLPQLKCCEFIPCDNPFIEDKRIRERIEALGLAGSRGVALLNSGTYQLMLVDAPEVPAEEMVEALRWRIKDLVSFDVDQAEIDYIELPQDAYRGRSQMVYAVAAERGKIEQLDRWCGAIGLELDIVDIPEFALLNLTEPLANSEAGLAVFALGSPLSSINMLADGALYFTRSLSYDTKRASHDPEAHAGTAVLELQRSLDYYESQVGKPPCVKLLVIPPQADTAPLMTELRYNLPVEVLAFDLNTVVSIEPVLDLEQQRLCTLAVAAALRDIKPLEKVT